MSGTCPPRFVIAFVPRGSDEAPPSGPARPDVTELPIEAFRASVELNLVSAFVTLQATLPNMRALDGDRSIAFTTSTSDAALPRAMQALEQLGVPRRIVGFVIPTGYAFNLDGSTLYLSLAVLFVAQAARLPMSWGDQLGAMLVLMLSSKGVAEIGRASCRERV